MLSDTKMREFLDRVITHIKQNSKDSFRLNIYLPVMYCQWLTLNMALRIGLTDYLMKTNREMKLRPDLRDRDVMTEIYGNRNHN